MTHSLALRDADDASRDLVRRVPTTRLGGMPIAVLGMKETAELMVAAATSHPRPNLPLSPTSSARTASRW